MTSSPGDGYLNNKCNFFSWTTGCSFYLWADHKRDDGIYSSLAAKSRRIISFHKIKLHYTFYWSVYNTGKASYIEAISKHTSNLCSCCTECGGPCLLEIVQIDCGVHPASRSGGAGKYLPGVMRLRPQSYRCSLSSVKADDEWNYTSTLQCSFLNLRINKFNSTNSSCSQLM
jgi:hypothetical protein